MDASRIDHAIINFMRRASIPAARIAIAIVFIWFGALKVIGVSPASTLVGNLLAKTMPLIPAGIFVVSFGVFEMIIGFAFLLPRLDRIAIGFLAVHLCMTFLPLVLLPHEVWTGWFIPTLEGQYIIKNLVIAAAAMSIAARVGPLDIRGTRA